jgi:hypothetical protein
LRNPVLDAMRGTRIDRRFADLHRGLRLARMRSLRRREFPAGGVFRPEVYCALPPSAWKSSESF